MKKVMTLVLVVVFMVTGTAFAANASFSDIPTSHWAYGAVTKLAQDGLIDGYGDGTFRGDKPMSRYEFAILVTKTLDKYDKANAEDKKLIDALSSEFAKELNTLGARIAKVETKTNTWISGDTRMRWVTDNPGNRVDSKMHGSDNFDFRQRIKFAGTIDDNWSWQGRLSINWGTKWGNTDPSTTPYGSTGYFDIMNVSGKGFLGLDTIRAGRSALDFMGYGLIGKPLSVDGVLIKKTIGSGQFSAWTGNVKSDSQLGTGAGDSGNANQLTTAQYRFKATDNFDLGLGYYWADEAGTGYTGNWLTTTMNTKVGGFSQSKGYDISAKYKIGEFTLLGDYVGTTLDRAAGIPSNPRGYVVQLSNGKGPGATAVYYSAAPIVNPSKKGTDAWALSYRSIDPGAIPSNAGGFDTTAVAYASMPYSPFLRGTDNLNAWFLSYENVLAKNIILSLEYQDIRIKNKGLTDLTSNSLDKTFMTKFEFFY